MFCQPFLLTELNSVYPNRYCRNNKVAVLSLQYQGSNLLENKILFVSLLESFNKRFNTYI